MANITKKMIKDLQMQLFEDFKFLMRVHAYNLTGFDIDDLTGMCAEYEEFYCVDNPCPMVASELVIRCCWAELDYSEEEAKNLVEYQQQLRAGEVVLVS